MRSSSTRFLIFVWMLLALTTNSLASSSINKKSKKKYTSLPIDLPSDQNYAYVTLLYSDDFLLGVRTLGQSLRETQDPGRPNIEHLVLVTPRVGAETRATLRADGWKVKAVEEHENPNQYFAKRLHGVYTKLEIFGLTEYHRVVYLDADTILLENTDELFLCGPFCAVMRQAELINTGVLVVEPSHALLSDLTSKVQDGLYSYTGGDQGFLNSYYQDYAACPYFEPMKQIGLGSDGSKCRRLPHRYNGDWPFAILNGKLEMVRSKNTMQEDFGEFRRARIMHYTFGSIKPWLWYTGFMLPFSYKFTNLAERLPVTKKDKRQSRKEGIALGLGLAYLFVWMLVIHHGGRATQKSVSHRQNHPGQQSSSCCHSGNPIKMICAILQQKMLPRNDTTSNTRGRDPLSQGSLCLHFLAGYACLSIGVGVGYEMVPGRTHRPVIGFSIFLIWAFGVFFSLYSLYMYRWYLRGAALRTTTSAKGADLDLEQSSLLVPLTSPTPPHGGNGSSSASSSQQQQLQQQQPHASARMETMTYCAGFVGLIGWGVWVRVHAFTDSIPELVPPILGIVIPIVGLTVIFYRLPILWYQEGLSV